MGYRPGRKYKLPLRGLPGSPVSSWLNFTPLSLQPDLWLDASDISTITSSGSPAKVSQWDDKSGNGRNFTQSTAAQQPLTNTRTINNLNTIEFTGNEAMTAGDVLDLGTNSITVFAVVKSDIGQNYMIISKSPAALAAGRWTMYSETNNQRFAYQGPTTTVVQQASAFQNTTTPFLQMAVVDRVAGVITQKVNRAFDGRATFTPDSASSRDITVSTWIGVYRNSTDTGFFGFWFDGQMAEIIVCLRQLTFSEIATTEQYLYQKWGLNYVI